VTPEGLQTELEAGRIRPAYLLAGSEALLRDDALAAIRAVALAGAPEDFNLDRLDAAATTPAELGDALGTLPVLATRRLVVLRDADAKSPAAQKTAAALAELVPALASRADTTLVVTAASVDRRARWVRAFVEAEALVECEAPRSARELAAFVRAEARRQQVPLETGVAERLVERIGPQLYVLRQEIAKAALLAGEGARVTAEHVERATSDVAEEKIWDLTDAIGEGRTGDALGVLSRLLRSGAPHAVLLGSLASHFRRLLRTRHGVAPAGPPFVVRKLEAQARRYAPPRLQACLSAIHEADLVLKGRGNVPPELALEWLVIGLSS
jgi:DNA polymerase-3 subunit delta